MNAPPAMIVPPIRLGINIDHIATLRNARGGQHPDPLRAAQLAIEAGADNITAHLREDRRHITDEDIARLATQLTVPLNMEMAVTPEMLDIAHKLRPHAVCLVPEGRQELTTEGGLDVVGHISALKPFVAALKDAGIQVALFIDPDREQVAAAAEVGADAIELHTGTYCTAFDGGNQQAWRDELHRVQHSAFAGAEVFGLEVHAGHGLNYWNVRPIAQTDQIVELNIGHYLVGEAIFVGLAESVRHMRDLMDKAREDTCALVEKPQDARHPDRKTKAGGG